MYRQLLMLIPIAAVLFRAIEAEGQEFKVLTRVFSVDEQPDGRTRENQKSVSLTIFHAGRVYDYIDSVGEVIVFEPTENRFTIMSATRSLSTTVDFDEVRQILKVARHETEKYVDQLAEKNDDKIPPAAESLIAQFIPRFEESWKPQSNELILANPYIQYRVLTVATDEEATGDAYLHYADWIARLNFVLHPQTMYPEPRVRLNEALRGRNLIPVEVDLTLNGPHPQRLRAEHKITWKLDNTDRSLIHEWTTRMNNDQIRRVSFQEYQKAILISMSPR